MARAISVALAVSALLALAPAADAATQRYATPNGATTGECPQNQPCDIYTAFTKAQTNDELIIGTGDYGSQGAPLTTPIVSTTGGLDVHGEDGKPRPRIFGAPTTSDASVLDLSGSATTLRYVEIRQLGTALRPVALTFDGANASNVVAVTIATGSSQGRGCVLLGGSVLTNSVCETTASDGVAIFPYRFTGAPLANTSTIRNVTALAPGVNGLGIFAIGGSGAGDAESLIVTNTIIVVPSNRAAIQATKQNSGSADAKITIDHSNFGFESKGSNNLGQIVKGAGNQQLVGAPKFAAPGDYHIAAGSITIDKGADDPLNGPIDIDGDTRTLGQATDMGADEFVSPPVVTTGGAGALAQTSAVVNGTVNPERLGTTYHFDYGTSTAYSASTPSLDAGAGTADVPVNATLSGLAAGTTYHYRVVGTNAGGATPGADMTFTTQPAPGGGGGGGGGPHFVGGLTLSNKSFAAAGSGPSFTGFAKRKPPIGTKVTFTLSAAAAVRFSVERASAGRRSGKRCVKPTKKNSKAKKCTRYVRVPGAFSLLAAAGKHSFRFTGRMKGKKLPVGAYRLVGVALNAGQASDTRRAGFKIVRR